MRPGNAAPDDAGAQLHTCYSRSVHCFFFFCFSPEASERAKLKSHFAITTTEKEKRPHPLSGNAFSSLPRRYPNAKGLFLASFRVSPRVLAFFAGAARHCVEIRYPLPPRSSLLARGRGAKPIIATDLQLPSRRRYIKASIGTPTHRENSLVKYSPSYKRRENE